MLPSCAPLLLLLCIQVSSSCYLVGYSMPGYSLSVGEYVATPDLCQAQCQATTGCAAFTWTNHTNRCNLKTTWYGTKNARAGKVTGPAFCLETDCFKTDTRIVGSELDYWWTRHTRPTPEQCQNLCQKTQGCHGFTWTETSTVCRLKTSYNPGTGTTTRQGKVSGPASCSHTVGGSCPPPACLTRWVYDGEVQTGCADPGYHGGLWCPYPDGVNAGKSWIRGSDAFSWCQAPSYCVTSWVFQGQNQTGCSSVGSPGKPWCPTQGGVDQYGKYQDNGSYIYCTPDMCIDPGTCEVPPDCADEWRYSNKTEHSCSTEDSPGIPWCPASDAVDSDNNYVPGGRRVLCNKETCRRIVPGTNNRDNTKNRIVGGRPADPDEWPWLAALLTPGDGQYCGGTLISDSYVLTAAHCVDQYSAREVLVKLGEYDFNKRGETKDRIFDIESIKVHEDWNDETYANDIALLKLKRRTRFHRSIWPIALPRAQTEYNNTRAFVLGWGTIYYGGPLSDILQEVNIRIWDNKNCRENYEQMDRVVTDEMLCAGEEKKDACQGDSGGPLNCLNVRTGRWELCGVVSWGARCADPEFPGVYTRVTKYLHWIKRNIIKKEQTLVFY